MNNDNTRALEEGVQMNPTSKEDYRAIVNHLNSNKNEYHKFQTEKEKSVRVVIKGILEGIPIERIKTELQEMRKPN